jgi:dTDP-4-dehydrorhamnose reductase
MPANGSASWRILAEMRLAVTGTSGQITQALAVHQSRDPDIAVLPIGRPALDLTAEDDLTPVFAALRPDVIVNCAAFTAVDAAEDAPEPAFTVNGYGAGLVAGAARRLNVPVIQMSTDYVFDGTSPCSYSEPQPTRPLNVYGRSKLAGEEAVAGATANHVILRTSWVYAPAGGNFATTMLRLAGSKATIRVVDDQHGAPTYAPDLAAAIVTIARNLITRPADLALRGVFHLTSSGATSWAGFAEALFDESTRRGGPAATVIPIASSDYGARAARPQNSRLDCSKAAEIYGIAMPDWRDGCERFIRAVALKEGWTH